MDSSYQPLLDRLTAALEAQSHPPESQLASCLSESWFSNTLAWYLDPRAAHGLGTRGADLFLKIVAKARLDSSYRHGSTVKWGKEGPGRGATTFNLGNAAVIREFFLSGGVRRSTQRGTRFCDLVLLDLDHPEDGLFVVVENKLFTCNRPGQLTDYHDAVEHKFYRVNTREYVYLTLRGEEPAYPDEDHSSWLRIGWTTHLLPELFLELANAAPTADGLADVVRLLSWLRAMSEQALAASMEELRRLILDTASVCLWEELERLRGEKPGGWQRNRQDASSFSLVHSQHPARMLHLELLPDCSVTIQTRAHEKRLNEKILVPFGAHPDQVLNLLQVAARDVVTHYFDRPDAYVDDRRRRRSSSTDTEVFAEPLFKFVHRYRHALKVCFLLNAATRRELAREYERDARV